MLTDLSESGAALLLPRPVRAGDTVSFHVLWSQVSLRASGTVRRAQRTDSGTLVGLEWEEPTGSEALKLSRLAIDLTARQYVVLVTASQTVGASQQDIIDATGIDRSTVSQIMQTMIRKGLLKRRRTREDARAYAITLTEHGRDVLKASEAIATGVDEALIAALPATRAKTFIDNLRTIITQREEAEA